MPDNKLIPAAAIGAGAILVWSGINNKKILDTTRSLVKGEKPIAGNTSTENANQNFINQATGNLGAENAGAAANQARAKLLAAPLGWSTGQQWDCLVQLWNDESGWSNTAENPSGAYGIAQALPNTKYPKPGQPPSEGGRADPTSQIIWGLAYIGTRYGTPCNALAHENANGWY